MRKILTLFCVFLVLFSISACESQKESPTEPKESSYEDALQLYEQIYNGDLQKIRYTAPQKAWDTYLEETGKTVDDVITESEATYQAFNNEISAEYGSTFSITLSIANSEHCDAETLAKIGKALHNDYKIDEKDVKDAYKITVSATVTAGEGIEAGENEFHIVNINNDWYLINYYAFGDEGIVGFAFI